MNMQQTTDLREQSLFSKLRYYRGMHGIGHAILAGIGRKSIPFWKIAGPLLTHAAVRRYLKNRSCHDAILNLGSGSNRIHGALNVDIDPRADCYVDITRALPLPDRSFGSIYSEEVLEHVHQHAGERLVRECFRILASGGIIRLTTPNLDYFCHMTQTSDRIGRLINEVFYGHGHRHIYSEHSLSTLLEGAGFENITFGHYQDPDSHLGQYDTHAQRFRHPPEISLYVEARKPGATLAD